MNDNGTANMEAEEATKGRGIGGCNLSKGLFLSSLRFLVWIHWWFLVYFTFNIGFFILLLVQRRKEFVVVSLYADSYFVLLVSLWGLVLYTYVAQDLSCRDRFILTKKNRLIYESQKLFFVFLQFIILFSEEINLIFCR